MKRIVALLLSSILAVSAVGCGSNSSSDSEEEKEITMIDRSLTSIGDTTRLKAKIKAAQDGEEITLGYIGGSITEGLNAGDTDCYAKLSYDYFNETYGKGDNVKYVNAGMSGTPSVLGNLRAKRDIFDKNADVIFIEFAVNDGIEDTFKESYESLIRAALSQENSPAVVLIFNVLKSGHTAQEHMKQLGEHYKLPMVSVADALTAEFDAGRMVWTDYSDDESHPHKEGHKMVADMIINLFDKVNSAKDTPTDFVMPTSIFDAAYDNSELFDIHSLTPEDLGGFKEGSTIPQFPDGWSRDTSTENNEIKFKLQAKSLFLIYKLNNSSQMGTAEITINGEEPILVNANKSDGWNNPTYLLLKKRASVEEYEISIKMAEGSEDKSFDILGFGYNK